MSTPTTGPDSSTSSIRRRLALVAVAALALAACGSDDGAEVRDLGSSSSDASGTGSGSSSGSGSGSGSASAPADEPAECVPVNPELEGEATSTVEMTLVDYRFDQEEYEVDAGVVTFVVTNDGTANHEVAFLPGGGDVPYTEDGHPDEEALAEAGAFELEAFGGGQTCNATFELEPGTYTLFCIVPIDDDHNHYDTGMRATLVVT